jgi:hypothetical protein
MYKLLVWWIFRHDLAWHRISSVYIQLVLMKFATDWRFCFYTLFVDWSLIDPTGLVPSTHTTPTSGRNVHRFNWPGNHQVHAVRPWNI